MFLKMKIYATILSVYEIFTILFLHSKSTCNEIFTTNFCLDGVSKYFIFCIAVPVIVSLIIMWVNEIRKYFRSRHSFFYRAKSAVQDMASEIKDRVADKVSPQYFERLITAFLIIGLKRYADKNPKVREFLKDVIGLDIFEEDKGGAEREKEKVSTPKKKRQTRS